MDQINPHGSACAIKYDVVSKRVGESACHKIAATEGSNSGSVHTVQVFAIPIASVVSHVSRLTFAALRESRGCVIPMG